MENDNSNELKFNSDNRADNENTNKASKNFRRDVKESRQPLDVIDVQHECFGKAWGQLNPKLYTSPESKCIKCAECCKYCLNIMENYTRNMTNSRTTFLKSTNA